MEDKIGSMISTFGTMCLRMRYSKSRSCKYRPCRRHYCKDRSPMSWPTVATIALRVVQTLVLFVVYADRHFRFLPSTWWS